MIEGVTDMRDAYRDDTVAARYVEERFRQPLGALLHQRQVAVVRAAIRASGADRVLEIAPGPARLTVDVAPMLTRPPVVVDASAQMLLQARHRLSAVGQRAGLVEGDAFQLPFAATFDLAYSFRLIRHFPEEERARIYAQIARVLKPGGLLVFDAVNEAVSRDLRANAKPGEYRHYDALLSRGELEGELRAAGFEIVSLTGVQHRYPLMKKIQILLAPRSRMIARGAMEMADRSGGEPLEWIVVCRRA
jgi:ubiquinone/menaquinone biosynthesis C-methylase UbiE